MAERTCVDCGGDITHRHGNARLCASCRDDRQRELQGQGHRSQPCAVDDSECVPGRLRKGMCERHYRRLKTTGSTSAIIVRRTITEERVVMPRRSGKLYHLSRYELDEETGCWLWTGPMFDSGYGHISEASFGTTLAHRAFYETYRGAITHRDLDHLCRVRRCVNPWHLEPVTHQENIIRGVEARMGTRCGRGHDQTAPDARWIEPSTGRSYCRECKSMREKRRREQRKVG